MHFVDVAGISRVKVVPASRIESVVRSGVGWSSVWAVVTVDEHFALEPPFDTPAGDDRLVPDATSMRSLGCLPGWSWAPASLYDQQLEPLATCPRGAVTRATEALAATGLAVLATFEVEMTLLRDGAPATPGPGYSVRSLVAIEPFVSDLAAELEHVGIPVEQLHPEYSPGQFEVSTGPCSPLEAADRLLLLRFVTRAVAARHGLDVSFAPVAFAGGLGNGNHLHLSLWRDGVNLMADGADAAGMHPDGAAFVAGLLAELPALMAVIAPSIPSYLRLVPGHWSGAYTAWGVENREAALRFIPGTVTSRARSANVELKTVDGAANPYLAIAAALVAGAAGVARKLALPEATSEDPATLDAATVLARAIRRLPATLGEAIEPFAMSETLRAGLGPLLHASIAAVRRKEWADHGADDEETLVALHRFLY
jgi:glutamine synthetase